MVEKLKLYLPWQVLGLLMVVLSLLLYLLWNALFHPKHKLSEHYQQMMVIEGIALQSSQAHLWLEEYVASQAPEHVQQVKFALDKVFANVAKLEGIVPGIAHHKGHETKKLKQEVAALITYAKEFQAITEIRLGDPKQNQADGVLDERLDHAYADILASAKKIEMAFKDDFAQHDRERANQKSSIYEQYHYITVNQDTVLQLSQAHLWLEEYVSSQNPEHLSQIERAMALATDNIEELQSIAGKLQQDAGKGSSVLIHDVEQLAAFVAGFQSILAQRLAVSHDNKVDGPLDESMDKIYADILTATEQIEAHIKDDFAVHEFELSQTDNIIFMAVFLLALLSLTLIMFEDRKRRRAVEAELAALSNLSGAERKFADLFELSPVSLWLEDFSVVAQKIQRLKEEGVSDFAVYCESHPELIMECVKSVRILDVNQATIALHGAASKEELLKGLSKTFTEKSMEAFKAELFEIMAGATETKHAGQVKKLDGSIVDVIVSAKVMPGHEEKLDKVLVALIDVTAQAEVKRMLQKSETRFRSLVEQSPLSIQILSPTGETVQVNQAWKELWGITLEDLQGYCIFEDEQLIEKGAMLYIQRAFAGEAVAIPAMNYNPDEGLVVRGPKNDRLVRVYMYPVLDEEGEVLEVVLTHEDVTEQVEQERRITESQKSLAFAQHIAQLGNWELDLQTNHLRWSDEIFRIFEIDKNNFDASYETFLAAVHPEDRDIVHATYNESLITKQPYDIEHRLVFADGRIKYVHERCENFFDETGKPIRSVGTMQDVTELTLARLNEKSQIEKIEHVQRLESLGVLAGGIAHDFNNLLTVIMGNAALANKHTTENTEAKHFISNIESTSERAASLCKQMLAYSGKGKFIVKPVQLGELVEDMSQLLMVSIAKNIVMRFDLNKQIPAVDADVTQMQQIIMNLVINASEAIGERSGSIAIATGVVRADKAYLTSTFIDEDLPEGLYVYLEVSDTGVGMDETTKKRLFDPFYTTKFTGRGLGMAAVLGIVRGHHGAIKVYSELGKGSTFKVLLPCSSEKSVAISHELAAMDGWRGGGTVLVVDDEETIREVISSMLNDIGFDVLTASDGLEGVEMYRTHEKNITAVILDMTMPRMGGEDAFTEMCRINPKVKVILSSGYNQQDATSRFAGKGLAGFLQKPYMPIALARTLKQILHEEDSLT